MDVNKTDAVIPTGQSGPSKEEKRGGEKPEPEQDTDDQAGGSPWEGSEAFAVEGLLAGDLSPEIQKAFEGLARQIEPLRAEVERAKGRGPFQGTGRNTFVFAGPGSPRIHPRTDPRYPKHGKPDTTAQLGASASGQCRRCTPALWPQGA